MTGSIQLTPIEEEKALYVQLAFVKQRIAELSKEAAHISLKLQDFDKRKKEIKQKLSLLDTVSPSYLQVSGSLGSVFNINEVSGSLG